MLIRFSDARAINGSDPLYVDSDQVAGLQVDQEHPDGPKTIIILADDGTTLLAKEEIDTVAGKINQQKIADGGSK